MTNSDRACPSDQALVSDQAATRLAAPRFDPSRGAWYAGDNEEFYRVGPCLTREEAIDEGRDYFGEDRPLCIIQAETMGWSPPDASQIIDMMIDQSDDLFIEDGFDDMAGTKDEVAAAEADLNEILKGWLARHRAIFPNPTTFGWIGHREELPPEPSCDSDGSPKGGNAAGGAVHDSAAIAPEAGA